MAREMLDSEQMKTIVCSGLGDGNNEHWVKEEVEVEVRAEGLTFELNVTYFYNEAKNAVVIASPMAVRRGRGDAVEPSYEATIQAIENEIGRNTFSVSCALLGKGSGERHYTAYYREAGENPNIRIFDSKVSSPDRFLNSSDSPNFFERVWGYITAPFKAFGLWAFGIGKQVNSTFLEQDVVIHRLGTQPMFDGVSCGLHSAGAILAMVDSIDRDEPNSEQIFSSIRNNENLDFFAEAILNENEDNQEGTYTTLNSSFDEIEEEITVVGEETFLRSSLEREVDFLGSSEQKDRPEEDSNRRFMPN